MRFTIRRLMVLIAVVALLCLAALYARKSSVHRVQSARFAARANFLKALATSQRATVRVDENLLENLRVRIRDDPDDPDLGREAAEVRAEIRKINRDREATEQSLLATEKLRERHERAARYPWLFSVESVP